MVLGQSAYGASAIWRYICEQQESMMFVKLLYYVMLVGGLGRRRN